MAIVPITLPPGMMQNGTPYSRKNRWSEGNLVRWHDGSLRPIGGWEVRTDTDTGLDLTSLTATPADETVRDGFTWVDNSGARFYIFGSNEGASLLKPIGDPIDVTPAGFIGSANDPSTSDGFGDGYFGTGAFGTPRPVDTTAILGLFRWDFDTWGEEVLASAADPEFRGKVYALDPNATSPNDVLIVVPNAPTDVNGMVVTDERIVMTIGSDTESRIVRWSDRENREVWASTIDNYAGEYFLQGSGRLLAINKVLNQTLLITETDAHVARWVGAPFVYGFDKVADKCGALSKGAIQVTDRFAIWVGRRQFWLYDGTVRPLQCDVMDELVKSIDFLMVSKIHSVNVPEFNEIWWFYQSVDADEIDSYVAYDYLEEHWQTGKLNRTCAVSGSVFVSPVMVDDAGVIYNHELRTVEAVGAYAETGPLELSVGERNLTIDFVYLDTQAFADISFSFLGKQFPTDPVELTFGPYTYDNPLRVRATARQLRMRVDGLSNEWEVGNAMRFNVLSTTDER